jgi:hypothetical protein
VNRLPYGDAITAGPMRCESAQSGITCRDVESGHGFSISREAYRIFWPQLGRQPGVDAHVESRMLTASSLRWMRWIA